MNLTEFLTARINEDERRLDAPDFSEADSVRGPGWGDRGDCPICGKYQFEGTESATEDAWYEHAEHAHQRTRVLAECEAKRRIVELHFENDPGPDAECGACGDIGGYYSQVWPCPTIKALATVYADHPDYDEAWRV